MQSENDKIIEQFRHYAGEENFRRFVWALNRRPLSKLRDTEPGLLFWQEDLWKAFLKDGELDISMDSSIASMFAGTVRAMTLFESELPEWCKIDSLEGVRASDCKHWW